MNKKCQVFTPADYVEELLNSVGYTENLYGKKILENSCGDGNVLVAIVQRYIRDCKRNGLSGTRIKNGLGRDIFGVEIDKNQYKKCIDNLNKILEIEGIKPVSWKIYKQNYLKWKNEDKFDFISGNPPYITYKELKKADQVFVKNTFISCSKGKFDYCYAFIEKSINSLNENGKMSYLIPSSIFKTVFGLQLRNCMKPYIEEIKDYTQEKMFDNALVKSSIMVLNKSRKKETIRYIDMTTGIDRKIDVNGLIKKWFFTNVASTGTRRFGDYFKISHVVATLFNEAFVLKDDKYIEQEEGVLCDECCIEYEVVRETATPRSLRYQKAEKIIFPYAYENGQLLRYEENEFEYRFPNAAEYLNRKREKLDKRQRDHSAKWFEYGRSQALVGINCDKLLISTVITDNVMVYNLPQECVPYAGMYIVPQQGNSEYTLENARGILMSRDFMQYVLDVGIHISGSSLRITSKDIADYRF